MAGVSPEQGKPADSTLDDEELVNDSLGEETPADSTGLDEEGQHAQPARNSKPSNRAGFPNRG